MLHSLSLLKLDWYTTIVDLTNTYGKGPSKVLSINISENLNNSFREHWSLSLDKSEKLAFYKTIKSVFEREKYLKLQDFTDRSNICKLRISAHRLAIEQGRYTSPITPRNERVCL